MSSVPTYLTRPPALLHCDEGKPMTSDTALDREIRRVSLLHARELASARRRGSSARSAAARVVLLRGGGRALRRPGA